MFLSPHVEEVFCTPGNPGISQIAQCIPGSVEDFPRIAEIVQAQKIDLVIIGPDDPLAGGIVDFLESKGIKVFGPRRDAAKLEWSKYFAKEFMLRRGIPTARYAAFDERAYALAYAQSRRLPIVIKADGLAKGKGVTVANTREAVVAAINNCFDGKYGEAGRMVVIEDALIGYEASIFAICDGENYALLPTAQDYKRLLDGDKGPNTGGMGAIAPHPQITPEILQKIDRRIIKPTIQGMKEEGRPYKGFLYVGVMIDAQGDPWVIEFNSRLGDPETQVVLPLLECDLFEVIWKATQGNLGSFRGMLPSAETSRNAASVCLILASQGYPEKFATGLPIRFRVGFSLGPHCQLIDKSGDVPNSLVRLMLFHSGTRLDPERNLITAGGRVVGVTALAGNLFMALKGAYTAVEKIDYPGKYFRTDIGAS